MVTLGYDIGSSSIKASLLDTETGEVKACASSPANEMQIFAHRSGWAEQNPAIWWENLKQATFKLLHTPGIKKESIGAIGLSYQMHGLILVDANHQVIRPAIIWCDSRAVDIGARAFVGIGKDRCLHSLLNSPGNFTASKLRWVKEHEPDKYVKIYKFMLPGDYIAMQLTGEITTTVSGLSEAILWDFEKNSLASSVMEFFGIDPALIPSIVPTFGEQGRLSSSAAAELELGEGIPITYRAGDQPNNALSLKVLKPGEIAATAGTSGVVYGISDILKSDPESRVNSFAHVNHTIEEKRIGILLCINGTGIANSWIRKNIGKETADYNELNAMAEDVEPGSDGVMVFPFGNGAERMLGNRDINAHIINLNFNRHSEGHLVRAVQEGIAFAFMYGINIMKEMDVSPTVIRAGLANMFLSPIFCTALSDVTGNCLELFNTDGAQGAARGAAYGAKIFPTLMDSFKGLARKKVIEPKIVRRAEYMELYARWEEKLQKIIKEKDQKL